MLAAGGAKTVNDATHPAERAYSGVSAKWVVYRSLTPDEATELEAERRKLRVLAAQLPSTKGEGHAV